jgi:hypothetical protein
VSLQLDQFRIDAGEHGFTIDQLALTGRGEALGNLFAKGLAIGIRHGSVFIRKAQCACALPFRFGMRQPAPLAEPTLNKIAQHVGNRTMFLVGRRFYFGKKRRREGWRCTGAGGFHPVALTSVWQKSKYRGISVLPQFENGRLW